MLLQAPFIVVSEMVMLVSCQVMMYFMVVTHTFAQHGLNLTVSSSSQTAEGVQVNSIHTVTEGSGSLPWSGHLSSYPIQMSVQLIWDEGGEVCHLLFCFCKC